MIRQVFIEKAQFAPFRLAQATATTTTTTTTPAPAQAPPSDAGGKTDLTTLLVVGGVVLAVTEVLGVTHILKWAGKVTGIRK
jgi:hypothetical protein